MYFYILHLLYYYTYINHVYIYISFIIYIYILFFTYLLLILFLVFHWPFAPEASCGCSGTIDVFGSSFGHGLRVWPYSSFSGSVRSDFFFFLRDSLDLTEQQSAFAWSFFVSKPWSFTTSCSKNVLFFPSLCSPVMLSLAFCSKAMNHSWWQVELAIKAGACLEKAKAMKAMVILQCKKTSSIMVIDMKKWHSLTPLVSRYSFNMFYAV